MCRLGNDYASAMVPWEPMAYRYTQDAMVFIPKDYNDGIRALLERDGRRALCCTRPSPMMQQYDELFLSNMAAGNDGASSA